VKIIAISALVCWSVVFGAEAQELVQPLELRFGVSCAELTEKYSTESLNRKNEVETLAILEPEALFPRAYKMIASCESGVFNALVVSADSADSADPKRIQVFSKLELEADKKYGCPEIEDQSVRCAIFQKGNVFIIYTGEHSDFGEFALVYGYAADPAKVTEKILALQFAK
jgi:hypothetical protein